MGFFSFEAKPAPEWALHRPQFLQETSITLAWHLPQTAGWISVPAWFLQGLQRKFCSSIWSTSSLSSHIFLLPLSTVFCLSLTKYSLRHPQLCCIQFWNHTGQSLTYSAPEGCSLLQNCALSGWDGVNFLQSSLCAVPLTKLSLSQPRSFHHLFFDSFPHPMGASGCRLSCWPGSTHHKVRILPNR